MMEVRSSVNTGKETQSQGEKRKQWEEIRKKEEVAKRAKPRMVPNEGPSNI